MKGILLAAPALKRDGGSEMVSDFSVDEVNRILK
jgi:hypothetical protein